MESFEQFQLSPPALRALAEAGLTQPTPVQGEVIPLFLDGKDVIAQAPTGTGKTLAFALPILEAADPEAEWTQFLVVCPTRELAMQITEEFKRVSKYTEGVRVVTIYGGQNIEKQFASLRRRPQIVVGTPGRLIDHIQRRTLKLERVQTVVLDEADEMLDMGFRRDIDTILKATPKQRQTVLFSATLPKEIVEISRSYQTEPLSVRVKANLKDIPEIDQHCIVSGDADKLEVLLELLERKKYRLAIIFTNTRHRTENLAKKLRARGYSAEALHGDLKQNTRDRVMREYRSGTLNLLVATDVAARGIDVEGIEAVVNYDVPTDKEFYVHRIGRTARANRRGESYTIATNDQLDDIRALEKLTGQPMEVVRHASSLRPQPVKTEPQRPPRPASRPPRRPAAKQNPQRQTKRTGR